MNSDWIINLNMKHVEGNIEENLNDLGFGDNFSYKSPSTEF